MSSLMESKKKLKEYTSGNQTTKVYHYTGQDDDGDPYHVKHFVDGKEHPSKEYFTNDKDDAHSTAQAMLRPIVTLKPANEETELDEAASPKVFTIIRTKHRDGRKSPISGTLPELIQAHSYTLECGKSYQHEKGNKKINMNPPHIKALVSNLNAAADNRAANGDSGVTYHHVEGVVNEEKEMEIKESIATMLDQIATGDQESAAQTFQQIIGEKIGARLEDMKVDAAAALFGDKQAAVTEE